MVGIAILSFSKATKKIDLAAEWKTAVKYRAAANPHWPL
jgi:hypothetical protein